MDTLTDMITGYALAYLIIGGLVASIWWRWRGLKADARVLEQLEANAENGLEANSPRKSQNTQADPAQAR
ncbi:MAG: hypothetical protein HC915_06965 [Anaerolineae bacterium]|nr:hypothetical protein [Anaerolineae bacterium]